MRRRFERSMAGAVAPLAALLTASLVNPAGAGGLAPSPDPDAGARPTQCDGAAGQGCAHISGYIAAGSDFAAGKRIGGRPALFAPPAPPLVTAIGAAGHAAADAINRGLFLLQASHDDGAR